jgi:hypothetical protein
MAKKQLGGFAVVASVEDVPDTSTTDPTILLFYATPNPVVVNRPFRLFWTTVNVGNVRIIGPYGFDSGIISSAASGYLDIPSGINEDTTYTLVALDNNGGPILANNAQVANNLRVSTV